MTLLSEIVDPVSKATYIFQFAKQDRTYLFLDSSNIYDS